MDYKDMLKKGLGSAIITEVENRNRIMGDSINLIANTKNPSTFVTRAKEILEQLKWFEDRIKDGFPFKADHNGENISFEEIKRDAYNCINRNAIRVGQFLVDEYDQSSTRKKKNKSATIDSELEKLRGSIVATEDYDALNSKIDLLKDRAFDITSKLDI